MSLLQNNSTKLHALCYRIVAVMLQISELMPSLNSLRTKSIHSPNDNKAVEAPLVRPPELRQNNASTYKYIESKATGTERSLNQKTTS